MFTGGLDLSISKWAAEKLSYIHECTHVFAAQAEQYAQLSPSLGQGFVWTSVLPQPLLHFA